MMAYNALLSTKNDVISKTSYFQDTDIKVSLYLKLKAV